MAYPIPKPEPNPTPKIQNLPPPERPRRAPRRRQRRYLPIVRPFNVEALFWEDTLQNAPYLLS